jgi:hypothetical protein
MKNKKTIISIKAPRAFKPQTKDEFGYFLAGLIDADGHISKPGYVQIDFNVKEASIAYYIKTIIGHGEVSQERARLSVRYRCTHRDGLAEIANLICHKLRHPNKIDQYNTRRGPLLKIKTTLGSVAGLLDNHWLAGFIQGDGSLALILSRQKNKSFKPTMYVQPKKARFT